VKAALDWAEASEHIGSICHALDVSLILHHLSGEHARVIALASRLGELAEANALQSAKAKSEIYTGWASAMAGSMPDGIVQFQRGLKLQTGIGTEEDLPLYLSMRADLLERSGEIGQALSVVGAALEQAMGTSNAVWLPMLHHRHALLRARSGHDGSSVQAELEDALALARSQGVTAWATRISHDLARHTREHRPRD
jgi:predicted ATPase